MQLVKSRYMSNRIAALFLCLKVFVYKDLDMIV